MNYGWCLIVAMHLFWVPLAASQSTDNVVAGVKKGIKTVPPVVKFHTAQGVVLNDLVPTNFTSEINETIVEEILGNLTDSAVEAGGNTSIGEGIKNIGDTANKVLEEAQKLWEKYSGSVGLGVMLGFGLIFWAFGYRILKVTLFLAGFLFVGAVCMVFLQTYTEVEYKWILLIAAVSGLVGGILAVCLLKVGLFILGGFLGFWIGTFALGIVIPVNGEKHSLMQYLKEPWQYYAIVGACCVLFGLLALTKRFQKFLIILTTALGGSFCICAFIDHWLQSGFTLAAEAILGAVKDQENIEDVVVKTSAWALVIGCLCLTILGCRIQYWIGKDKDKDDRSLSRSDSRRGEEMHKV